MLRFHLSQPGVFRAKRLYHKFWSREDCVMTDSCFLTLKARDWVGKESRGPEGWLKEQGLWAISLQRDGHNMGFISFFPNERCYVHDLSTTTPVSTYPATSSHHPLRIYIPFCKGKSHCPPREQPGMILEQCFPEWVPENTISETDI